MKSNLMSAGVTVLIAAATLLGCQSNRVNYNEDKHVSTSSDAKGVDLSVEWLKNKNEGIDVLAWINNETGSDIFTNEESFHLIYKGQSYTAKNDNVIFVPAGERKKVILLFALDRDDKRTGMATLEVKPIYEGKIGGNKNKTLPELKLDLALQNDKKEKSIQ